MAGNNKFQRVFQNPSTNTTFTAGDKSKGILDDFSVRRNVATKEGTIEHVPTEDNHIVNKRYVDNVNTVTNCDAAYNITLTLANTEYSQLLTTGTKRIIFKQRSDMDLFTYPVGVIRFSFVSGKVATSIEPYFTLDQGKTYDMQNLNLTGATIYFASKVVGMVIEVEEWI